MSSSSVTTTAFWHRIARYNRLPVLLAVVFHCHRKPAGPPTRNQFVHPVRLLVITLQVADRRRKLLRQRRRLTAIARIQPARQSFATIVEPTPVDSLCRPAQWTETGRHFLLRRRALTSPRKQFCRIVVPRIIVG